MKQIKLFIQLKKITTFQKKRKRKNRKLFKNVVDDVTPCTIMAKFCFFFVKYSSQNIKFDVSEHFLKNELILVLLVLCITYERSCIVFLKIFVYFKTDLVSVLHWNIKNMMDELCLRFFLRMLSIMINL
mgnify:CR=1 FL=1